MHARVHTLNQRLAALPSSDFDLLRPHLRSVQLKQGTVLFRAGESMQRLYFPESGIVSLMAQLEGGETIEAAMVGCDSIVGGGSALVEHAALMTAVVAYPGTASMINVDDNRTVFGISGPYREVTARSVVDVLARVLQSAVCNTAHPLTSRLARWLLRARDLTDACEFPVTQDALAQKLGVRRMSVQSSLAALERDGLVRTSRGQVAIADVDGLSATCCECYQKLKESPVG